MRSIDRDPLGGGGDQLLFGVEGDDVGGEYSDASFVRALTAGVDPAGNKLAVAMPTYRMPQEDMANLIAYTDTQTKAAASGRVKASSSRCNSCCRP